MATAIGLRPFFTESPQKRPLNDALCLIQFSHLLFVWYYYFGGDGGLSSFNDAGCANAVYSQCNQDTRPTHTAYNQAAVRRHKASAED